MTKKYEAVEMIDKKICIIFDTNKLYSSINLYETATISGELKQIYDLLNELNLIDVVELVLPDITLEEIKRQQIDDYKTAKKNLCNILNTNYLPNISLKENKDFKIEDYVEEKMSEIRISLYDNFNILTNMNMTDVSFTSILERALEKRSPFEGKNKNSDKGFKDAVLWENILYYKKNNLQYDIILFTADKRFNENSLKKEYQFEYNEEINVINDIEQLATHISVNLKQMSERLIQEIKETKCIRENISRNLNNVEIQYKEWLEDKEAYGKGIKIFDIFDLETTNIVPASLSDYSVEGDYFALIELQAKGSYRGQPEIFKSKLYVDITFNNESDISLKLTGITLSKEI